MPDVQLTPQMQEFAEREIAAAEALTWADDVVGAPWR